MKSDSSSNSATPAASKDASHHHGNPRLLMVGALGVVFGDIGTSPLYALKACFAEHSTVELDAPNILGILS
jgi:K+ transporter